MEHDAVKLLSKGYARNSCIFPDTIHAYVNLSIDRLAWLSKVEGDNVSVGIMVQVLTVNIQQIVIGTKYDTKRTEPCAVSLEHGNNEVL